MDANDSINSACLERNLQFKGLYESPVLAILIFIN